MANEATPSGSHRTIGEDTPVKIPLGRTIAIVSVIAVGCVSIGAGFARMSGRIETLQSALEAHKTDQNAHLDPLYHMGHGRPVGNFDFTQALDRLDSKIEKYQPRPIICRSIPGGMRCEPKEAP